MIKFIRNLSLRNKLISLILFVTLSSLVIALTIVFSYNQKNLKERMARELVGLADIVGKNIMNTIIFQDNQKLQEILQTLIINKNIQGIYLLNSNNDVFVKYNPKGEIRDLNIPDNLTDDYRYTDKYLEVLKKFYEGDELVIKVYIVSNLSELTNQNKMFLNLTIIVLAIALVYAVLTSFVLQKPLVQPIFNLVNITEDITEYRDFTMRLENNYGTTEIGILYDGFNNMLEQIEDQSNNIIQAFTEISQQKKEIEDQKNKIDIQTEELQDTYSELKQHSREVMESIVYAKKIQDSVLPPFSVIQKDLPDSFLIYKPRDIVSGDFYWYANIYDKLYIAAADCTGHGVPGTLLSVLGSSLLNQIVNEFGIFKPAEILDYLDKGMRQIFDGSSDSDNELMGGMDIALTMIDIDEEMLEFAGAINPLYIVRDKEIIEIKGDPFSIVSIINLEGKPYTNKMSTVQPGDCLYMFSDGFPDQIGGPNLRKIKKVGLRKLLLEVNEMEMDEQKEHLENYFEEWKKEFDQVDDVILIGIRIGETY